MEASPFQVDGPVWPGTNNSGKANRGFSSDIGVENLAPKGYMLMRQAASIIADSHGLSKGRRHDH
jgi:hypothetical protein